MKINKAYKKWLLKESDKNKDKLSIIIMYQLVIENNPGAFKLMDKYIKEDETIDSKTINKVAQRFLDDE